MGAVDGGSMACSLEAALPLGSVSVCNAGGWQPQAVRCMPRPLTRRRACPGRGARRGAGRGATRGRGDVHKMVDFWRCARCWYAAAVCSQTITV